MTSTKNKSEASQHVKVVVRVRPLSQTEDLQKVKSIIKCSDKELMLRDKKYNFDRVFNPIAPQINLYKYVVAPMVKDIVEGYNCTVFTYGQTGTGKTYTMSGDSCKLEGNWKDNNEMGIIPRAGFHVFEELDKLNNVEVNVKVSYIELYNEEIRDLLSDDENILQMFADHRGTVSIPNLTEITVFNGENICKLLQRGILKRQVAPTLMNHQSSRSHTVFTIQINTREDTATGDDILKAGKINLVDLAGNENIARSGCKDLRATELANINRSLLTLGRVIHALADKSQKHVPYRDSKLTRILQDSLGGTTKTALIATVSPAHNSIEETSSTLDYATRARDIKNTPKVNEKLTKHKMIETLVSEIERLQKDLDAARSGTGYYVDKENYQKLLDAIAAVTGENLTVNELTQKKALHICNLEEVMRAKIRQFENTVEQCKKYSVDLENANKSLKDRDEILEQERFVSKFYENLSAEKIKEAQDLLAHTRNLHNEKEILLAKLERQFEINVTNKTVTNTAINNVISLLDGANKRELENMKASQEKIKETFKENLLDFTVISDSLTVIKELSQSYESIIKDNIKEINSKSWIIDKTVEFLNKQKNIVLSLEKEISTKEKQLKTSLTQLDNFFFNAHKWISSAENQISKQNAANYDELQFLRKSVLERNKKQENLVSILQNYIEEDNKLLANTDILINNISKKETLNENVNNLKKLGEETFQTMKVLEIPSLIDTQRVHIKNFSSGIKELEDRLEEARIIEHNQEKETINCVENLNKNTMNACSNLKGLWNDKAVSLIKDIDAVMENNEYEKSFERLFVNIKKILTEQILESSIEPKHEGDTPIRQSLNYPTRISTLAPRESLIEKFKQSVRNKVDEEDSDSS